MSDLYLHVDAALVKAEIGKLIAEYPELGEDETLLADVIEGQTNAHKIIERALEERQFAKTMAGAIAAREADMAARRGRFERQDDAMRSLIRNIMQAAGMKTLTLAEATLSITKPRQTVSIEDLEAIPQGYFRTVKQADKTAIKQALDKGEEIPGALLVTGSPSLTVRTK